MLRCKQKGFGVTSMVVIMLLMATLSLLGAQKMAVDMLAAVSQSTNTTESVNN